MLNEKQLDFLKTEFNIDKEAIGKMTIEEWREIRIKCFELEGGEALDAAGEDSTELSERGEIAASIVDTKYRQIFEG